MLKLIKLILYRIKNNKGFLITYLVLMPIVIGMAVYFTNTVSANMHVGLVGNIETVENETVRYTQLDTMPTNSQLVLNQYDAIFTMEQDDIKVTSTKGKEFDQAILLLVNGQLDRIISSNSQRGAATNILGFSMMVIMLLGVQLYNFYFDERNGINKRIVGTTIRCSTYMLSHSMVVFGFLFLIATTIICGMIILFDITIAMSLWSFIFVLFLLCLFATSFGVWINSLSKSQDESLMLGNMFAIVGSIICGSFVQVTNNELFNQITQIFPQKQIMSLLSALENNTAIPYLGIVYILGLSVILIISAISIEKRKISIR